MNKTLRQVLIHVAVGVVLFAAAFLFFNNRLSSNKGSAMAELANPSYPILEIGTDTANYGIMSGYRSEIDLSLVRSQIALTDGKNSLNLRLHNYDYDITAIQYILFEKSVDEPTETGTLNKLTEKKSVRTATLTFDTELAQGKEYYLQLAVRLDGSTRIFFYTKVQSGSGCHLEDYFAYALDFHEKTLDKSKMEELAGYLEPTADAPNNNLQHVTIHASSDAVTYGSMSVKQERSPRLTVREINSTYAVIELRSLLSGEVSEGVVQYYETSETYKLRYTSSRMYLLDYDRTMNAYYNESIIDSADNMLSLGIQSEKAISCLYADEGYRVCFVDEGQLWYYDYQSSDMFRVYSLATENLSDLCNVVGDHGIKLLRLDDKGNIDYLVYGYINRGRHEGMNGIQVMHYDAKTNCNEEISFLTTSLPYEALQEDLEKFAYLSEDDIFYCLVDGDLHKVDIAAKKDEVLKTGLVNESLTASKDQSIIAVEKDSDLRKNQEIEMLDLDSGKTHTFTCESGKRIRAVGFLGNDFIYGEALAQDVTKSGSGAVSFPISHLSIVTIDGKEVKSYEKSGFYVMETEVNGSVLTMRLGKKKGGKIRKVDTKDYIRYKEETADDAVSLSTKYSDTYWTQLYLKFPNYVYIQVVPDLLLTKTSVDEDDVTLHLSASEDAVEQYFVYASGERKAAYTNLSEAIAEAYQARGNVIDSNEQTLWQCIYADYAQVAGMDTVIKTGSDAKSLAGCLAMIATVNGKEADAKQIDTGTSSVADLLATYSGHTTRNLTGCTTDEILYYVSQGSPVLAKLSKNRYVIVMSYNATKIRYLDPVTGKSTAQARQDVTSRLAKAGNVFYSYIED